MTKQTTIVVIGSLRVKSNELNNWKLNKIVEKYIISLYYNNPNFYHKNPNFLFFYINLAVLESRIRHPPPADES